jgi:hypothetical protein
MISQELTCSGDKKLSQEAESLLHHYHRFFNLKTVKTWPVSSKYQGLNQYSQIQ